MGKFNTNGNILWTSLLGSSYIHSWQGITTSSDGNIYITGYTNENLDNIDNKINSGGKDAFLTKYDTNGNRVWTKIISSFDIIELFILSIIFDTNFSSLFIIINL